MATPSTTEQFSTDALPMSAREPMASGESSTFSDQDNQRTDINRTQGTDVQQVDLLGNIPDPPTDWKFNIFLKRLSDNLSPEELENMKYLFHGQGGIGRGVLEKMRSPQEFFRILRDRGYISRDNMLYLQTILYWAGRKDLVEQAVEYSNSLDNVLHFYAPTEHPENGYKYIKFHIEGRDFTNYSRDDIEKLRLKVGSLLCVPTTFIFIRGIQPSSSLVITLMVPDMYADILHDLLREGKNAVSLRDIGVDSILVDGHSPHNIKDKKEGTTTEQQSKAVAVYQQLEHTITQLERVEEGNLDLLRQVDDLQSRLTASEEKFDKINLYYQALNTIFSISNDELQPASLKALSSLAEFRESLHRISIETVDRKVVEKMVNATVNIVATRLKESNKINEQRMLLQLQDMHSRLVPMLFEIDRYKLLANVGNLDKEMVNNLQILLQSLLAPAQMQQTQIFLTPHGLQMMKKISSKLRHKEKEKLKQKYTWSPEGEIEKFMNNDKDMFLAGLFYKEVEQKRVPIHGESFVAQCLTEVSRDDLKKFLEQKPTASPTNPRHEAWTGQKQESQTSQQGKRQNMPSWQQQKQEASQGGQDQQQQPDQAILVTRMAQQIQEMYSMLQGKQGEFRSPYEPWKSSSFPFEPPSFKTNQGP